MSANTEPTTVPAGADPDGVREIPAHSHAAEIDSSLTPTSALTDPQAVEAASRRIEDDQGLSVAGAQGTDALAALPGGAARGSNLLLYLGVLVTLALLAAAIWAAIR